MKYVFSLCAFYYLISCVRSLTMSVLHFLTDKPEKNAEDRISSTAVAVNALFYTWTENQKLIPTTPPQVIRVIRNASQWLLKHTLSGQYKPYNVIFSGSVKTIDVSNKTTCFFHCCLVAIIL